MKKQIHIVRHSIPFTLLLLYLLPCAGFAMPQGGEKNIIAAKVLHTMDSGGYTYMQVANGDQKSWVAIPESKVEQGTDVKFYQGTVMKNFTSKTLNRTFKTIIFSPGLVRSNTTSPHDTAFHKTEDSFYNAIKAEKKETASPQINQQGSSGGSLAAIVPFEALSIKKLDSENGYTVDEIFKNAKKLNGKKIALRGKVVKFSPKIMGRNWIHLQDGTGNAMKNGHDLVITTQDQIKKGDIVIAEGILAANKNFGAGYTYEVIIEEATLKKE